MRKLTRADIQDIIKSAGCVDHLLEKADVVDNSVILIGYKPPKGVRYLRNYRPCKFGNFALSFTSAKPLTWYLQHQWHPPKGQRFYGLFRRNYFLGDKLVEVKDCDALDLATAISASSDLLMRHCWNGK